MYKTPGDNEVDHYTAGGKKRLTLGGALNCFKYVIRLLTFSDNCILEFSAAKTIDSLLDNVVVDLSLCGGRDGHMSMTFLSSSLLSLGSFVSLTHGIDGNYLV